MISGKVKCHTLKKLSYSGTSAKLYLVSLFPRLGVKITLQINGIPAEVYSKLNLNQLYRFNCPICDIKNYHICDACGLHKQIFYDHGLRDNAKDWFIY